jgi:hypothetical protein
MPISTNTTNPTTTVAVPLVKGPAAESSAFNFTLGPDALFTIPIEAEAFPVAFTITGRSITSPGNQSCSGSIYLSSSTATPLVDSVTGLGTAAPSAGTVQVTRSGSSLVLTNGPTNTTAFRLTRIN